MSEHLIWDLEANGLLDEATRLHSIQVGTTTGKDVTVYSALQGYPTIAEGLERISKAERLYGHNAINYDFRLMEKLYPGLLRFEQIFDTLIMARLLDPEERLNSLRDWGARLGVAKGDYEGDWAEANEDMMRYAAQDVVVTRALLAKVKEVEDWGNCLAIEQRFAYVMARQESTGFLLDVKSAQALEADLRGELAVLEIEARSAFPPIWATDGAGDKATFIPKGSNRSRGYTAGVPLTKVKLQVFNPGSRQQVADRLVRLGWKPAKFGADGVPTINDEILADMPWPPARKLVRYFEVAKMLGQLADGKNGWLRVVRDTGRVHGRVNTIGCAPGRCAHSSPNMGQVSKRDPRMRSVWLPRPGWVLVGCDGASIQSRALSHYLSPYDGGAAIEVEINGDKVRETDRHSLSRKSLECVGFRVPADCKDPDKLKKRLRDGSKRCLYAVLFGASDAKLGLTVKEECRAAGLPIPQVPLIELGRIARRQLFASIKGFGPLEAKIKATARSPKKGGKGYLTAPSGFRIKTRSEHSALVFLMQGFEASIMKAAAGIFAFEVAPAHGWVHGQDFAEVAHVHDEAQIEARPEIAEALGRAYADCIAEAGRRLGSRCPMEGSFDIGPNWAATH